MAIYENWVSRSQDIGFNKELPHRKRKIIIANGWRGSKLQKRSHHTPADEKTQIIHTQMCTHCDPHTGVLISHAGTNTPKFVPFNLG